jgi:hypothetical protein
MPIDMTMSGLLPVLFGWFRVVESRSSMIEPPQVRTIEARPAPVEEDAETKEEHAPRTERKTTPQLVPSK